MHSRNGPDRAVAAEIGSALAAVLTFSPCPCNRFCGQPIEFVDVGKKCLLNNGLKQGGRQQNKIEERGNSVYARGLQVMEGKGRMGRPKHIGLSLLLRLGFCGNSGFAI